MVRARWLGSNRWIGSRVNQLMLTIYYVEKCVENLASVCIIGRDQTPCSNLLVMPIGMITNDIRSMFLLEVMTRSL